MTSLTHPVTGHTVQTDSDSADFWTAAGYRANEEPEKKAPAKKAASRKSTKK